MADLEKVIKGLECEGDPENCGLADCPYFDDRCECEYMLHKEARELLKASGTVDYALRVLRDNGWTDEERMELVSKPATVMCKYCKHASELPGGDGYCDQLCMETTADWFCGDWEAKE